MAYKMKGAGEVYYDGNGDPVNLNPKNMIKLTGDEKYDEHGNEQYMNKNTKILLIITLFYLNFLEAKFFLYHT